LRPRQDGGTSDGQRDPADRFPVGTGVESMAQDLKRQQQGKLNQRRLRQNRWVRELVAETRVSPEQLIQPLFSVEGISKPEAIPGLTGTMRDTPSSLLKQIEKDLEAGVRK